MNKLKHTPGPWKDTISKSGDSYAIYSVPEKCLIVSTKRDPVVLDETWNRQLADGHLIAAAPEMLEDEIKDFNLLVLLWDDGMDVDMREKIEERLREKEITIEKTTGLKIEEVIC